MEMRRYLENRCQNLSLLSIVAGASFAELYYNYTAFSHKETGMQIMTVLISKALYIGMRGGTE